MERRRARQASSAEVRYMVAAARLYESQRTAAAQQQVVDRQSRQIDALRRQLDEITEMHHCYMMSHAMRDSERFDQAVARAREALTSGFGDFAETEPR